MKRKNKEILLFSRLGNKQTDIKYFKEYLPLNISRVVEPCGGTFAVIRNIYNDTDKYKLIVNDNDDELYKIYINPHEFYKARKEFNNICLDIKNECNYIDSKKVLQRFKEFECDETFKNYIIKTSIIRGSLIKYVKNMNSDNFIELMKKIKFTNDNYLDTINNYMEDDDTFIFIDPPYMFSDNTQYLCNAIDNTDIPFILLDILKNPKTKAKIMIIINKMKMTEILFKDYIKGEYQKLYGLSKKKDVLLIICNY